MRDALGAMNDALPILAQNGLLPRRTTARSRLRVHEWLAAGVALVSLLPWSGVSAGPAVPEYHVKAALLFYTAQDARWPEGALGPPSAPFVIGIYGKDPWGGQLQSLLKPIQKHPVKVQTFSSVEETTECHLLFISGQAKREVPKILEQVKGSTVITVGESDQFVELGGVLQLYVEKAQIRYHVNLEAAERARIRLALELIENAVKKIMPKR